ncbi:peptidylprolyl isomerase [Streptomyces lunaelactis]|uniref:peptidylprolyl isomerase n=1 Tax=Streptomyces lunaelactis TaxID=1535768 RepID=UPI00158519CD|nr:peptidylprolyl isomerase [Streptomyces lunaelactis]NUK38896.1 peptidylprolyl isomerase [Streptomyces lunaelactis]NUK40636.1 peptidylprolyl isomerase [Streptomyces lunaelactis]NUK52842.1 peptidylprolyl isomerase [Streptomyces lunaelactis]NUK66664.1 peptidylprolyl isomerase [Streptomyces lunaelactis]NUK96709.1 peptidylprolyl isomerase [Streptomyces lunaelactis]
MLSNALRVAAGAALVAGLVTGPTGPASAVPTCGYTPAGQAARDAGTPPTDVSALEPYAAMLNTSQGIVAFNAATEKAPCTTNSFAHLAGRKYFDGTKCHRLTTDGIFVLQCGDPTGTGSGGPGYQFKDENLTGATYPAGTVAMANAGPGTNGSQFFLVYKDTQLPANYTPFGDITRGMDVLGTIAEHGTKDGQSDGAPKQDVTLNSVRTTTR